METRKLKIRIWAGFGKIQEWQQSGIPPHAEYTGQYTEQYEPPAEVQKAEQHGWKELRIGRILDTVRLRTAVFRQLVKNRDDAHPTDIVLGDGHEIPPSFVVIAWSNNQQKAIPPGPAYCHVLDFTALVLTEEEQRTLAMILQKKVSEAIRQDIHAARETLRRRTKDAGTLVLPEPPNETVRQLLREARETARRQMEEAAIQQRVREEKEAAERRTKNEESLIQLDAKAAVEPPARTEATSDDKTESVKPEAPLAKTDAATAEPVAVTDPEPVMLTIEQAAKYARVDERTIRQWLRQSDQHGKPMLPGAVKFKRRIRILRTDLDDWRKSTKGSHKPKATARKRTVQEIVKKKT